MIDSTLIFLVLLPASISDLMYYKVPNFILLNGLVLSFLLRVIGDKGYFFSWLIGGLVPFLLCFILYLIGVFGASDVKLFSVVGSFYSLKTGMMVIVVSLFVGAAFSAVKMFQMKNARQRFIYLYNYLIRLAAEKKIIAYEKDESGMIPFAVCIFAAVLLMIIYKETGRR